ncbi:MAG: hypothetical protein ACREVX_07485 [Clostridium sp.]|uniref:hypothetical protein n=1 Tax=Clostridium sp. TaxID=1506 RepID=UPI003D6D0C86
MKNTVKVVICLSVVALLVIIVSIYRIISSTTSIAKEKAGSTGQVAVKNISDSKIAKDKKIADDKAIEDAKVAKEVKAIESKKEAELKVIQDRKIVEAKSKSKQNKEIGYVGSSNEKFAYSIMYPDNLVVESETDNGNVLKSEDGRVSLQLYGNNNKDGDTIDSIYNKAIENTNMYYKVKSGNWFVISYIDGDQIIYQKKVVGKASTNTFIFKFPTNEKAKYTSVVDKLEKSFKTSSTDKNH